MVKVILAGAFSLALLYAFVSALFAFIMELGG